MYIVLQMATSATKASGSENTSFSKFVCVVNAFNTATEVSLEAAIYTPWTEKPIQYYVLVGMIK